MYGARGSSESLSAAIFANRHNLVCSCKSRFCVFWISASGCFCMSVCVGVCLRSQMVRCLLTAYHQNSELEARSNLGICYNNLCSADCILKIHHLYAHVPFMRVKRLFCFNFKLSKLRNVVERLQKGDCQDASNNGKGLREPCRDQRRRV